MVQYKDLILVSVESAAIEVWILTAHDIVTPLKRPQLGYINWQLGVQFSNEESEKTAGWVGISYAVGWVGENSYLCWTRKLFG